MLKEIRNFIKTIRSRRAEVIAISDDEEVLSNARIPFSLPATVPEWLSPITSIIPGQLFAMHLAHARDYDVDAPRGLHKVTRTK
jgi:glutamine---fructose-6-phosphate transaminase (isomerizing)